MNEQKDQFDLVELHHDFGSLDRLSKRKRFMDEDSYLIRLSMREALHGIRTPDEVYNAFDNPTYWSGLGVVMWSAVRPFMRREKVPMDFQVALRRIIREKAQRVEALRTLTDREYSIGVSWIRALVLLLGIGFIVGLTSATGGQIGNLRLDAVTVGVCLGLFLVIVTTAEFLGMTLDQVIYIRLRGQLRDRIEEIIE